jgi:hypothetical protein
MPTAIKRRRRSGPRVRSTQRDVSLRLRSNSMAIWMSSIYFAASKLLVEVEKMRFAAAMASLWRLRQMLTLYDACKRDMQETYSFHTNHRGDSGRNGHSNTMMAGAINCSPIGIRYADGVLLFDEAYTTPAASMTPNIWMFWYTLTEKPRAAPVDVSER